MEAEHSNFHDARRILEEALRINPGHTSTLHALALVDMQFGDYKTARARLQQALRNSPRHAHSWATLGYLTYIEGSPAEARLVFESMVRQCGENSVLYAMWGKMEARSGDIGAPPFPVPAAAAPLSKAQHHDFSPLLCPCALTKMQGDR